MRGGNCRIGHLCLFAFWLLGSRIPAQQAPDFTQADAMLTLLRSCHENRASASDIDRVIALPGSDLVVAQQNISRRVTRQQFHDVLEAACSGKLADVKPAESGTRAENGVKGLTEDVAPSLIWGRDNVSLLQSKLDDLRKNGAIRNAIPLARKYLPEPIALNPKLYVVMGGRAGAAAIEDQLYFDILITEWRAAQGKASPLSPEEVVEFFAHETHHLGYGQILDRKRDSLILNPGEEQAWKFLTALMMEGSATLLINGHESLADLERQPDVHADLGKVPALLSRMQTLLQRSMQGAVSDEAYDEAVSAFLDMGYHAMGATLLAAIEKKRGLPGVMAVMADPRQLPAAYNDCAGDSSVVFKFDAVLADQISRMGKLK